MVLSRTLEEESGGNISDGGRSTDEWLVPDWVQVAERSDETGSASASPKGKIVATIRIWKICLNLNHHREN